MGLFCATSSFPLGRGAVLWTSESEPTITIGADMPNTERYNPTSLIAMGMFNFDAFNIADFKLAGTIRVSASDAFSLADPNAGSLPYITALGTAGTGETVWTATQIDNIKALLATYSQFANLPFQWVGDFDVFTSGTDTTVTPADVGAFALSDINLSLINRADLRWSGISGISSDSSLGYAGSAEDVFLNLYWYGGSTTLASNTRANQTLMHEIGHSLGLSHPHSAFNVTTFTPTVITTDFAAIQMAGFQQLGFKINSALDLYKEYFTIMSYDDQASISASSGVRYQAMTPMILDVIALQDAYGEGGGTTAATNDTITPGVDGYRTYFDLGGVDTVDLSNYSAGAYFAMGVDIIGAKHLVGVSMSFTDARTTIVSGGDPQHLRWYYGEFENAIGSAADDVIIGNALDNSIVGGAGNDYLGGGQATGVSGNDTLMGGAGNDTIDGYDGEDQLNGDDGADVLRGGDGNDSLNGGNQNDTLYGGAGNDRFDWDAGSRQGADVFYGGTGDDLFVLDTPLDQVIEYAGEGSDTIYVTFTYSLANLPYVESLRGFGSTAVSLVGNAANNVLVGGTGDDTLEGGVGNDTLNGDAGSDTALYAGVAANYAITKTSSGTTVRDLTGLYGTDTLTNVEYARFADKTILLSAIALNNPASGSVTFAGILAQGQTLVAANTLADADGLGVISYQWQGSVNGLTWQNLAPGTSLLLQEAHVGQKIRVMAIYQDGLGSAENVTSPASAFAVTNVNDAPTGSIVINGSLVQGQLLTVSQTLADVDGLGSLTFQWQASVNGSSWLSFATGDSVVLQQAQVGQKIRAVASYIDGHGTAEVVASTTSFAVANLNDAPKGKVTLTGTLAEGQTLTASNTLTDLDGLGAITYQWQSSVDGSLWLNLAQGATYTLSYAQSGRQIRVAASYVDGYGAAESVASTVALVAVSLNHVPTGALWIAGTFASGNTLVASNTFADADGMGTVSYAWQSSIDGTLWTTIAKGASLTLPATLADQLVRSEATYTDGHGTLERVVSCVGGFKADGSSVMLGTTGNDTLTGGAGFDTVIYAGDRRGFSVTNNDKGGYTVKDNSGAVGTDLLSGIEKIQFMDVSINLTVQAKAASIAPVALNSLIELYVAYFNRVPDADGLSYWIDQYKSGKTLNDIGNSFVVAAIQFSSLTGYSATMTNAEFVRQIYKNVLGRTGATAPPDADVSYWANNLATGTDSRGTLVKTMLSAAHAFKGDSVWGWVANLLDNKVEAGHIFAVNDGLTFNTGADSVSHGMAIAAAVTSNNIAQAIQLIGVTDVALLPV